MDDKFFRERNADFCKEEFDIIVPTKEELKFELKKKLFEKLKMIDVVFDAEARQVYLQSKNKEISKDLNEIEIRQEIGLRVLVDYLDLTIALCEVYGYDYEELLNYNDDKIVDHGIFREMFIATVKKFVEEEPSLENMTSVAELVMMFINVLKLDIDEVEQERIRVEKAEGSFLHGKILKQKQ